MVDPSQNSLFKNSSIGAFDWKSYFQFDTSVWILVAVNFIPVLGGLFLGWDIRGVLLVYWAENLVIGFYNVLKMAMISNGQEPKFFLIPFFIIHFGGFCAGHGFFILIFLTTDFLGGSTGGVEFDPSAGAFDWPGPLVFLGLLLNLILFIWNTYGLSVVVPVIGLFISHGISFKQNFLDKEEYKTASLGLQMFRPYGRIVIMHIAIIFAALPIFLLGSPMPLLILLIVLKTGVDIFLHNFSHSFANASAQLTEADES